MRTLTHRPATDRRALSDVTVAVALACLAVHAAVLVAGGVGDVRHGPVMLALSLVCARCAWGLRGSSDPAPRTLAAMAACGATMLAWHLVVLHRLVPVGHLSPAADWLMHAGVGLAGAQVGLVALAQVWRTTANRTYRSSTCTSLSASGTPSKR